MGGAWRETLHGGTTAKRQRTPRHAAFMPDVVTTEVSCGSIVFAPDGDGNSSDSKSQWPGPEVGQSGENSNAKLVALERVQDDPGAGNDLNQGRAQTGICLPLASRLHTPRANAPVLDTAETDSCNSTDTCDKFWQDYQARTTREPAWQGTCPGLPTIDQPMQGSISSEDAYLARRAKLKRLILTRQIAAATKEALRHPQSPVASSRNRPLEEFRSHRAVEDMTHSVTESLRAMGAQRRGLSEARKILEQVVEPARVPSALSASIWSKIKTVRAQSDFESFNDLEVEDSEDTMASRGMLVGFRMEPIASIGGA